VSISPFSVFASAILDIPLPEGLSPGEIGSNRGASASQRGERCIVLNQQPLECRGQEKDRQVGRSRSRLPGGRTHVIVIGNINSDEQQIFR
jgi:hypothetical protein